MSFVTSHHNLIAGSAFVSVAIYLIGAVYVASHLKRQHNALWVELGEPGILTNSIAKSVNLLFFVFSNRHRESNDPALFGYLIATRVMFFVAIALYAVLLLAKRTS